MKDYKNYYIISESPEFVYLGLTKQETITLWTGYEAEMIGVEGTEFSMWNESIVGKILELIPNKKIVQQWYFGDQEEESIVIMKLHPHKKGTSIELTHSNIPDEDYENMVDGWNETYMAELKSFYEGE